jgi:hypothetical protein
MHGFCCSTRQHTDGGSIKQRVLGMLCHVEEDQRHLRGICLPHEVAFHVKWVPCHQGTARPQVAGGGDGLPIWRVAVII